jgi:UDP-N-acetylmuramate dehydrogenase
MLSRLHAIPGLQVSENVPLSGCTRFAIGGPARWLVDISTEESLAAAIAEIRHAGAPFTLIGGGTNLIVSDEGFPGVVLRYTAGRIEAAGPVIRVEAGAALQSLVDFSIERGLGGLETLTGIPGWVGGAIYGNAGAYGHSIQERIESVRVFAAVHQAGCGLRDLDNAACDFAYRESVFKQHKDWVVTSALLRLQPADAAALSNTADGILKIRNEKYPPTMRCAGSIFKNLILDQLSEAVRAQIPASVIREGKVPSAYFLEQVGAKGMVNGAIRVADYHANLIYNTGGGSSGNGSAADLRHLIQVLKSRVREAYGLDLEEEVQYVP